MEDMQTLNKIVNLKSSSSNDESSGYDEAAVFFILSKMLISNKSREPLGFPAFSKYKSLVLNQRNCFVHIEFLM